MTVDATTAAPIPTEPKCFDRNVGPGPAGMWAIEPGFLEGALSLMRSGHVPQFTDGAELPKALGHGKPLGLGYGDPKAAVNGSIGGGRGFELTVDGIAVIPIAGPIQKYESKFGGASSIALRRTFRTAAADARVRGILAMIDSPGGQVFGTMELADTIAEISTSMPVFAHIDDKGASAAYWLASQANVVAANAPAAVGNIGVYAVLEDSSEARSLDGVKVHVVSTGAHKGAGVPGTPISEEVLANVREHVEAMNELFLEAIDRGREGLSRASIEELADGRMFTAPKALELGLVDAVRSADDSLEALRAKLGEDTRPAAATLESNDRVARADAMRAELEEEEELLV